VKGCLGEEEHALTVNDYDKGFCHGFNLYHSQITKRLKDAGVLNDYEKNDQGGEGNSQRIG
jgi:hypothetical protein